ncbi:GGDEF and EAL domain-containing protein [Clostridium sp. AM58-1XD]|uniref:bifunctional diguanylate cyclase/phosphodiesterase n=1 Tax=Clostridium sp. AM58-1XD TaxID=2292307 RepID=UPI000E496F4A|nr:GGDEF and EAL domain-containing protein [Clostridium sp. AM58-1XD]RGZ00961.1 EAL domain-containing protein [Clostridium sp. AM58-1XD]
MNDILDNDLFQAFSTASHHVYIYVCDMKTDLSRWSENAVEYFDMPGEYMTDAGGIWLHRIHPEDRSKYTEDLAQVFSGKTHHHKCEYRAMNRYGEYVWLECRGTLIYNPEGKPKLFAGIMTRLDAKNKYDPLTNLMTIYEFNNHDFSNESGSLLLIDLDHFREIINKFGYSFGDTVLYNFSRKLETICSPDQYVYRLEGDEFIILLPGGTRESTRQLFTVIQHLAANLNGPDGQPVHLGISGGAVLYPENGGKRDVLLGCLEHSLEHAKHNARGNVVFFSQKIAESHNHIIQLQQALRKSILNHFEGFQLYYQPLVGTPQHKVTSCEALLRWSDPALPSVAIGDIIKLLEFSGEICAVGRWIVDEVFKKAQKWQKDFPGLMVGFNVSYLQFKDPEFVDDLIQKAKEYRINPNFVCIELTESSNVDDFDTLAGCFKKLRSFGFCISLDDFGIAYSTLLLIRNLPVDSVKIDHSFILHLTKDNAVDLAIIESIVNLCRKLDIRVVVEGVENAEILDITKRYPFSLLQGYYFDRPMPADEFEEKIFKVY